MLATKLTQEQMIGIAAQLLKTLRNNSPQKLLAERLGVHVNQISRWETAERPMRWTDFVKFADVTKAPLPQALELVTYQPNLLPEDSQKLILILLTGTKANVVAKRLGLNRFVIARWTQGKTQPTLPDFFWVLYNFRRSLFVKFVKTLAPQLTLPELKILEDRETIEAELAKSFPGFSLVLRYLELKKYQNLPAHSTLKLAQWIGAPAAEIEKILSLCEKLNLIQMIDGLYAIRAQNTDTRGNFEVSKQQKAFLNRAAMTKVEMLTSPPQKDLFGHLFFSISDSQLEKVRAEYFRFFENVRSIIAEKIEIKENEEGGNDRVIALGVSIFETDSLFPTLQFSPPPNE